jgi:RNA polymerase sigma-70 factor (ECF subfamily)
MSMAADLREPDTTTDEQLMRRVAGKDLEAFGLLVERHHERALAFAYRLTADRDGARDAAQETFLRILGAARRYRPKAAFTTYLYAIVRNTVREADRRRRREEPIDPRVDPTPLAVGDGTSGDSPPPDLVLQQNRLRERLADAIGLLPDDLRTVFVLSEIEGVSYREISEICGCPMGTVASRKHAAVRELRKLLGPLGRSR